MGKRELVALINLSSWCLMMAERLFLPVPQGCLRFVIVVFPDHTHYILSVFADESNSCMMTSSKQRKFTGNCLLKDIKGS